MAACHIGDQQAEELYLVDETARICETCLRAGRINEVPEPTALSSAKPEAPSAG